MEVLCEQGVDTLFGYPGGQAIKIYDALYDSKKIHHVLARHEQGEFCLVEELDETERGEGGYGHTGVK